MYHDGSLSDINYARLVDRILMNNSYPQLYGTQTVGASYYAISDVINANSRRIELGLPTLEEKAIKLGFIFNIKDHIEN